MEFEQIWCVDFEFRVPDGERPTPICLVAHEVRSGQIIRLWDHELRVLQQPLYSVGKHCLFVAYYASAEMGCHLALHWPMPKYVLDLFAEFRVLTNGLSTPSGNGLLGALAYFGIDGMDVFVKEEMRQLALRGGPWTKEERQMLLDYCESDVVALPKLLGTMDPKIDLPRALLRGRYMKAAARMEWNGVPINVEALESLRTCWTEIQNQLIARVDKSYGVYDGRIFKADQWEQWVVTHGIPWPRLQSGKLDLKDDTFKEMARAYPEVNPIRELRASMSQLRLESLSVGSDGRNRTMLSAFQAKSGRNQPSTSKFIFGPAVWLRHLIQPRPGCGLAYVDWSQQEFGIAAVLSEDPAMLQAYQSGDPYLAFAKQAGAAPLGATKATHGAIREQYKACVLAVQYGMGADSLATRIGKSPVEAQELLKMHRRTYPKFWQWSDGAVDYAKLYGRLYTVFGWPIHLGSSANTTKPAGNPRSLRNFPMQANGAEMLRLACCLATERGICVCAPVHDALLIEVPVDRFEAAVAKTQDAMAEASAAVLGGFKLRSEAKLFRYPDHFHDERGEQMWSIVWELVEKKEAITGDGWLINEATVAHW
ncbi:MAG: DNA polymerase I [Deltaproteobacteria bacterium]|nr:DNA polymerase I [Deltaproteobacteria bacterium]